MEVASQAQPPVCRLLEYGKFKYDQTKKEREARKHHRSRSGDLSEVRMRPRIGQHDVEFKLRQVFKLLEEGNKVKISIVFRGRERDHPELGLNLLKRIGEEVKETTLLEKSPSMEGRSMIMVLAPVQNPTRKDGSLDREKTSA